MTGGRKGVRARASTACSTASSQTLAVVRLESDRSRAIETSVRLLAICSVADAMLFRCLTDACPSQY